MAVIGPMRYLTIGGNTYEILAGSGTVTSVGVSNATNGGLTISGSPITTSGTITVGHSNILTNAQTTQAVYPIKIDKNGHISEYGNAVTIPADENMKWTATTSSNTYYPLQSTSTGTTGTANTLNSVSFYQYYNTAGGYRRLILGNATSWKSTGGAYGTIRLYGAAATNYGDLVPGVLGTTSGDGHLSANRTWTLPDDSGTIALTKNIPSVPTTATNSTTGITASTTANTTTVGSSSTDYGVKSVGSGSFTQGTFSGGSFTQGTDSFTANVPTKIDTTKFNAGSYSHSGFSGGSGSFTQGSFTGGSLVVTSHVLSFTPATHGSDSHTHTAATYGTDSFTAPSLGTGFYTAGTAASFTQGEDSFTPATHGADSHTHTAPTLGSKVPTVSTTSATVTITDNGHTHTLS